MRYRDLPLIKPASSHPYWGRRMTGVEKLAITRRAPSSKASLSVEVVAWRYRATCSTAGSMFTPVGALRSAAFKSLRNA